MSSIPKPKSRKPEFAKPKREMAQRGKIESSAKPTDFKSEVDYAIWRAVCREPSPWLINSEFKEEGTFQERFIEGKGDTQILLWAIWDYARRGKPIPKWVTEALYDILFGMAKGNLKNNSWNDAFGKPYADAGRRKNPGGRRTQAQMFDAFNEVKKLVAEKKSRNEKSGRNEKTEDYDGIHTEAGKRLRPRLSGPVVKKLTGEGGCRPRRMGALERFLILGISDAAQCREFFGGIFARE